MNTRDTVRPAIERAAQAVPTGAACLPSAPAAIGPEATNEAFDCRSCGACCSYSAEWPRFSLESEADLARIPRRFVDDEGHGIRCIGTRCAVLVGVVGRSTSCAIYPLRPDVCRACSPGDPECLQARRHFGL